jgi:hypothetical protein
LGDLLLDEDVQLWLGSVGKVNAPDQGAVGGEDHSKVAAISGRKGSGVIRVHVVTTISADTTCTAPAIPFDTRIESMVPV